jgi:hypothetical protein
MQRVNVQGAAQSRRFPKDFMFRLMEVAGENHKDLAARVEKIEDMKNRQNSVITILADEIGELEAIPEPGPKRRIGFPRQG